MTAFDAFIDWLLGPDIEGGYVNDPNDPGGETKFGIAKRYHPDVDIKNLTRGGAVLIYAAQYWAPIHGDDLPPGVAFITADAAVNESVETAIHFLQRAVGVAVDGVIGPATLAAAKVDPLATLLEIAARRMVAYAEDPNEPRFEVGWARRLMSCVHAALAQT